MRLAAQVDVHVEDMLGVRGGVVSGVGCTSKLKRDAAMFPNRVLKVVLLNHFFCKTKDL